ncbi:hypothetical protein HanRHA438_Chr09g0385641 [Helianthus annuus]|uniref:Hydroxyproline-rich glycoprotein family protein n=1 Tax=Helianthus annuus TaxID=4232 RepID=A0A251U726_HELAN|nr:putative uncharacterized protein DDB_G0272516 [Helianthus annuus]XP_021977789.1 putative uncharacterized protein DDB_G0272516 [Helianthus annuus]XP_035833104.1 putative uncharacterized protein DDB_G0272516 [Helianthus annuus]KAJ0524998.1 hypothetical protein HanHA300_Chr09g0306951 [Helianthus annuus]KAJ0532981.1 hypothetical protein HanIR_Chr09g0403131 [Helianthus annuus]KAJ0541360.1 hypothetical protein HanHA89_Chr09g0327551 [Helianthus annuus]KAJ0706439.1 hypothetical protein HanLR1_Chr0
MRGRSRTSSKQMETDTVIEAKEEPRLSGAYIRTLVKHLTSKDPLDVSENNECYSNTQKPQQTPIETQPPQQPQHKKQVRRRLHTSKPYQERLLNMAEARREIVTALKFHRASMKQQEAAANNQAHQSPPQSTTTATTTTNKNYWHMPTYIPPPPPQLSSYNDNQNFVLPTQSLGLNLNFQNFSNLNTNIYHKPSSMSTDSPSSSSYTPSSSCSPALSTPIGKPISSCDLHHAMDDEEMEEIRSLGEQHQIEWNDTVNLVTSARWCSFLNTMKLEADEGDECDVINQFDQIMEFPQWLINANESSCLQQHFDHQFSDAYFQDPALPCMDIGEIEAMDGEWLA